MRTKGSEKGSRETVRRTQWEVVMAAILHRKP